MFTTTCDKTGIEFQAESKRQKNHPLVSKFLDAAGKDNGRYIGASRKAQQILAEIKSAGYGDISEAIAEANAVYADWRHNGNNSRKVMSHKDCIAAGERIIRNMRRMDDGVIEELNDGVGGRYNGSVR